jgi:hypothetical protein
MGRYPPVEVNIQKAYEKLWGTDYQLNPNYIPPVRLLQLLEELNEAEKALDSVSSEDYYQNCLEYIENCFINLQVHIDDNNIWTRTYYNKTQDYSMGAFLSHLRAFLPDYNHTVTKESGMPKLLADSLTPSLEVFLGRIRMDRIHKLQCKLEYNPDSKLNVNNFVSELLAIYFVETSPENIAAFKHLIWMIKRSIFLKDVPESLFFILYSSMQHMGKTTFFRKLCTGFEWIYDATALLSKLLNPNDFKSMCRNKYLLDFQELSITNIKNPKTNMIDENIVAQLKGIITTDKISGREMYMSIDSSERKTPIMVSSSNQHIYNVVNDASGMRRYWEFQMKPPKDFDREFYLAANDYFDHILLLYQAIDENNDNGFYYPGAPEYENMRKIQDSYARENPFLTYCHRMGWEFSNEDDPDAKQVEIRKIISKFNDQLKDKGDPPWRSSTIKYVIAASTDSLEDSIMVNGKPREVYWIKGWDNAKLT